MSSCYSELIQLQMNEFSRKHFISVNINEWTFSLLFFYLIMQIPASKRGEENSMEPVKQLKYQETVCDIPLVAFFDPTAMITIIYLFIFS